MKAPRRIRFLALAFLIVSCAACARPEPVSVTLLYTADAHGRIVSGARSIGLDVIAAVHNGVPGSILLDAGDFLHGSPLAGHDGGKSVVSLMREAGYFAAAVGNHEFSHGFAALMAVRETAPPMHLLSANILSENDEFLFTPWALKDANGIALCVFGLTTPDAKTLSNPDAVRGLSFKEARQTALETAASMRQAGCDIIVALTHLGSDSVPAFSSRDLASVPGVDAIVDGHSHIRFADLEPGKPPVVSSGSHAGALGQLTLEIDRSAKKILSVENTFLLPPDLAGITPDANLAARLKNLEKTVDAALFQPIAESPHSLPGDRTTMRTGEAALGDLAADAIRAAYGADIAVFNGGGIREGLPQGALTRKHLTAAFPFGGHVVSLRVNGSELLDILEHALSHLPDANGAFPQISGFSAVYSRSAPPGKRLVSVNVGSSPLLRDAVYTLAVPDFLAAGGDGYPHLAAKRRIQEWMATETAVERRLRQKDVFFAAPQGRLKALP